MDNRTADWVRDYSVGFQIRELAADGVLYTELLGADHCGVVAERQGG
jgi:hypothetical protein